MLPVQRRRIFEPFFTTNLGKGGSGLGMYIAYNLATRLLGGELQVDPDAPAIPGTEDRVQACLLLRMPQTAPR